MVLHCNNRLCQSILGLSATVLPTTSEPFHKNSEAAGPPKLPSLPLESLTGLLQDRENGKGATANACGEAATCEN
jgi:hypothetical protein